MDKLANSTKRQQINASSRTVFTWVAAASVIVSFSAVAIVFLIGQLAFKERVLEAKETTVGNLRSNLQTADALKTNVNLLLSNPNLAAVKTDSDSSNLQVVFDALPTAYDSANFGASLQGVLLNGTVASIEGLSVTDPSDTGASTTSSGDATTSGTNAQVMPFTLTVTGSAQQIQAALANMEASIRPIHITALTVNGGSPLTAHISGETYYDPGVSLGLTKKVIKP